MIYMLIIQSNGYSDVIGLNINTLIDKLEIIENVVNSFIDINCILGPINNSQNLEAGFKYYILTSIKDKINILNNIINKFINYREKIYGPVFVIKLVENNLVEFKSDDQKYILDILKDYELGRHCQINYVKSLKDVFIKDNRVDPVVEYDQKYNCFDFISFFKSLLCCK